jgi:fructose-bisphosphate aldolase class I
MDGDHDIDVCEEVTEEVLRSVFNELVLQNVWLEGTLLKPNMVISGQDCPDQAGVQEVAERTVRCLKRTVPAAVPGVVFLSGGQSDQLATEHLNAMNKLPGTLPWKLSFSYGRALQAAPLKAWAGKAANLDKGQAAFLQRARDNAAATTGSYAA